MRLHRTSRTVLALTAVAALGLSAAACGRGGSKSGSGDKKIGIDFPRSDSDFWNSYAKYVNADVKSGSINALPPTNSNNQTDVLVSNVSTLTGQGAKVILIAPQDTGAIASTLENLASKHIPVVSVDTRPDKGQVYMVVRADNQAYGTKACQFLGAKLKGTGTVVEFEGDLTSINGRDRSQAFGDCMSKNYPDIKVEAEPTNWEGDVAASKLQDALNAGPVNGIYMQAGGVFLAPTLSLLQQKHLLVPPTDPKHIFIISNDGIPAEFQAIKAGQIDATISQPADLYAKYGLFYAQAAAEGKTFSPGPTDHGSTIIQLPNGLEDQLPAPLVTAANVDDPSLWANQLGK
ncbi:sugar ABC transporter substrate-binding protein [Catenulispora sp. NF23]|uniref:Sugar ABC transporter substrate-binding protein n=1 Tax=Catenulispora pinistramenti TaxID=2705254 RepID=A0ABS5KQ75_9ACTN|nr:sugar ABC transporter substrate-binding protein [Catenulispora pinistramenti]MBS2533205.1 sugar ABC transporter substrate-binding protein [Catenulispora pinistramenti]MBS2548202.1 sugar ABC transporter substrate-binding protein [Catenulispora pinistramenti]